MSNKIDSNSTGLYYAEETTLGAMPSAPAWNPLEPNTYSDFGTQVTTVSRNPINPSRQTKRGSVTDIASSGGYNHDFVPTTLNDMFQGFFFCKLVAGVNLPVGDCNYDAISRRVNFTVTIAQNNVEDTLEPWLGFLLRFKDLNGNVFYGRMIGVDTTGMNIGEMVSAGNVAAGSFTMKTVDAPSYIRSEPAQANIVRHSYSIARTLGSAGYEYMTGCVPNEISFNLPSANKATVDMSYVGINGNSAAGSLPGTVNAMTSQPFYNTSTESAIFLSDSSYNELFAFCSDVKITINNNVTVNKAIGTLGGFDATAGSFAVTGTTTAYLGDLTAIQAVRNSVQTSLIALLSKKGSTTTILDIPNVTLGNGRLNVTIDQPIELPLDIKGDQGAFGFSAAVYFFS